MQNWSRAVGVRFRSGLTLFGFALLLLVPAFWKATLIIFSSIAVLRSRDRDALAASEAVVRGRFWLCLGFGSSAVAVAFGPMIILESIIAVVFDGRGDDQRVVRRVRDASSHCRCGVGAHVVVVVTGSSALEVRPVGMLRILRLSKRSSLSGGLPSHLSAESATRRPHARSRRRRSPHQRTTISAALPRCRARRRSSECRAPVRPPTSRARGVAVPPARCANRAR